MPGTIFITDSHQAMAAANRDIGEDIQGWILLPRTGGLRLDYGKRPHAAVLPVIEPPTWRLSPEIAIYGPGFAALPRQMTADVMIRRADRIMAFLPDAGLRDHSGLKDLLAWCGRRHEEAVLLAGTGSASDIISWPEGIEDQGRQRLAMDHFRANYVRNASTALRQIIPAQADTGIEDMRFDPLGIHLVLHLGTLEAARDRTIGFVDAIASWPGTAVFGKDCAASILRALTEGPLLGRRGVPALPGRGCRVRLNRPGRDLVGLVGRLYQADFPEELRRWTTTWPFNRLDMDLWIRAHFRNVVTIMRHERPVRTS